MPQVRVPKRSVVTTAPVPPTRAQTEPNLLSALATAQRLIEKGWCQRTFTRAANGTVGGCLNPDAARHCLLSALDTALVMWRNETANPAWLALVGPLRLLVATAITRQERLGFETRQPPSPSLVIVAWNDLADMSQAQILTLLEEIMQEL